MIKLGYKASAEQFGPGELLKFSVLAEELGFDSVFVSDHFQPWKHTDGHAPQSLVWLGALGAQTSRVMIGTSVLTPTFRYHPSLVAQAFGTLGVILRRSRALARDRLEGWKQARCLWPSFETLARLGRASSSG